MNGLEEYGRIEGFDAQLREEQALQRALRARDPLKQPRRRRLLTGAVRLLKGQGSADSVRWIVGASVFGAIAGMAVALLCVSGEWLPAAGIVGAWGSAGCWTMAGTTSR